MPCEHGLDHMHDKHNENLHHEFMQTHIQK
jgi:hypothetical protein